LGDASGQSAQEDAAPCQREPQHDGIEDSIEEKVGEWLHAFISN